LDPLREQLLLIEYQLTTWNHLPLMPIGILCIVKWALSLVRWSRN
jgi:hypothetical protein